MHIEEIIAKITPVDAKCAEAAQKRFDNLIKPVGSLAKLEIMISRYAAIVGRTDKNELDYPKRSLLIWGGTEDTAAAAKIMEGRWPVSVLAAETGAEAVPFIVTAEDEESAMEEGAGLVQEMIQKHKLELLGFGCLASADNAIVRAAMTGGLLQAAAMKTGVILDGLAVCRAAAWARELAPLSVNYFFAGHVTEEEGDEAALEQLSLSAPLRLNITSGSGDGAAMAFTLFDAGLKAYKEMETFEEAGVHVEVKDYSRAEETKRAHWKQ